MSIKQAVVEVNKNEQENEQKQTITIQMVEVNKNDQESELKQAIKKNISKEKKEVST